MYKHHLQNYLRTHRKRLRVNQRHVAFLIGSKSGTKVSRYEQFSRVPDLPTVFALEVIYGVPSSELFAGIFDDARRLVEDRAGQAIRGPDPVLAAFARLILDPSARPPAKPPTTFS